MDGAVGNVRLAGGEGRVLQAQGCEEPLRDVGRPGIGAGGARECLAQQRDSQLGLVELATLAQFDGSGTIDELVSAFGEEVQSEDLGVQ